MISPWIRSKLAVYLLSKPLIASVRKDQKRNVQITIFGGASETGSNLAMLLKQNYKVSHIKLYDDEEKVKGYALELNQLPGGPKVLGYTSGDIIPAVCDADMILVISKQLGPNDPVLETNAVMVQAVCNAVAAYNPSAFLALSVDPINSIVPFAANTLDKVNAFNPFKLLGITNIDEVRSKSFAGSILQVNPREIRVPVIGGHSDNTVVPLFSNITPESYSIDFCKSDMLTRLVKRADYEISKQKMGNYSTSIAKIWAINEFCQGVIDTLLYGTAVELHCFTANPHFGTRYFAGPNIIGPYGISEMPTNFKLTEFEAQRLNEAVRFLNKDIKLGEELFSKLNTSIPSLVRKHALQGVPGHIAATRRSIY